MTLEAGTLLGPYEIVAPLGRGGMGEVYLGRDTRLGRSVAIKVVTESLSKNPQFRERLTREAKIISQLQHPHVCTLHDIGEQDGLQYLVMEFLEGETLEQRLRGGALALEEALRIGREIAEAVDAAHRNGVVHRDLKPGNVMLGKVGTKVLDFGLAKEEDFEPRELDETSLETLPQALTEEHTIVGTVPYMAPEQLEGRRADARTDIWALGCILYEMVTGARPFRGVSKANVITAIMSARPESMTGTQPLASARLEWIVSRCLAKDPEKRWQSARDLALELAAAADSAGDGTSGWIAPATTAIPATPSAPRTGRAWLVAAAVAIGVAVLAGTWLHYSRPEAEPLIVDAGAAVAVLPFENLTGEDELGYVGLGLAAGLISQLSELPTVNVVGRSKTWNLRESARSAAELAERLGANVLIEGEVHRDESGLRVDVGASDAKSSRILWTKSFEGTQDGLYELQQQIAAAVARVTTVSLSRADRDRISRGGPSSRAFDYYLQGLERLEQHRNPRHLDFAIDLFRQAIRLDGAFAAFHAELSTALWRRSLEPGSSVELEEVEREARRALELDPSLPEGHVALARALRGRGRYAESIAELRPLLSKHPKPDEAFRELGYGYEVAGDQAAALECLQSAVALGPLNWFNSNALGAFQASQGDLAGARASLERALELAPDSITPPRLNLGAIKIMLGDYQGAIADFEATGMTTSNPDLASNLATAYYFEGRLDQAEALFRRATELDSGNYQYRRNLGDALQALGRESEAVSEFRRGLEFVEVGLEEHPSSNALLRARALLTAKAGDCGLAVAHAEAARPLLPTNWQNQLDLAMTFALCERPSEALEAVRLCLASGLPGAVLRQQAELEPLLDNPEFLELTGGG